MVFVQRAIMFLQLQEKFISQKGKEAFATALGYEKDKREKRLESVK